MFFRMFLLLPTCEIFLILPNSFENARPFDSGQPAPVRRALPTFPATIQSRKISEFRSRKRKSKMRLRCGELIYHSYSPFIMGCINYRFPFGARESHQTGFIFRLSHIVGGPPNPALVGIDTSLGDIPQSDLRLTINYIGSYAD